MASITRRGGAWRARYRDPSGRQRERRFTRKVDAVRWLDEQTAAHVTGTYVDPTRGRVTVGDWAARWLDGKGNVKASTATATWASRRRTSAPPGGVSDSTP
jgi:hypothetical protein